MSEKQPEAIIDEARADAGAGETFLIHDARTGMLLGEVQASDAQAGALVFAEHHNAIETAEADDYPGVFKMKRADGKVAFFRLSAKPAPAKA